MQTPLNPNAQAWLAALRSGDYQRGQSALHELAGRDKKPLFCCLGVACDLFAQAHPDQGRWVKRSQPGAPMSFETATDASQMYLPIEVSDWLGLKRRGFNDSAGNAYGDFLKPNVMGLKDEPEPKTLTGLNDEEDYSFKQIADVIESQPKGLFYA